MLDKALQTNSIAVCVKDLNKRVQMQNEMCRRICGDQLGKTCEVGCMELYEQDEDRQWNGWGSRSYRNSFIHGGFYDVTLICGTDTIITFLQSLQEKYEMALAYYREKGLTRRETEVVALSIRGISNSEICKSLSISKATLRTHLNNIYRKIRDLGEMPEFLPASRIQD